MANLTTTVRDASGRELFRMTGRQPAGVITQAALEHAAFQAEALKNPKGWTVTTQRGSTPAKSYEEMQDG